jgi:hypothetical protein
MEKKHTGKFTLKNFAALETLVSYGKLDTSIIDSSSSFSGRDF